MPSRRLHAPARADVLVAGVAVLVGIALRLGPHLADQPYDELCTAYVADPAVPFRDMSRDRSVPDFQPPLYSPLMSAGHQLAGTGEARMRLPGGRAGAGAFGACAALLRTVFPPRVPLTALALLAPAWPGVLYAHAARAYAPLYAPAAIGDALAVRDVAGRRSAWARAALLAVALLAGGVHYYGMVLGCTLFTARGAGALASGRRRNALADVGIAAAPCAAFLGVPAWQHPYHRANPPAWALADTPGLGAQRLGPQRTAARRAARAQRSRGVRNGAARRAGPDRTSCAAVGGGAAGRCASGAI
jgi:hypothetical protein